MDHNESKQKFERWMGREADHAQETAIELGPLIYALPEKSRQLADCKPHACAGVSRGDAESDRELTEAGIFRLRILAVARANAALKMTRRNNIATESEFF